MKTKPFYINGIEIKNRYVLAPMAGLSDYALRYLAYKYGAGLTYTEMVSCESLVYSSKATLFDLTMTHKDKSKSGNILSLQIFSGNPKMVLESIPLLEKNASYDFLDFNCGCPVPKVVKQHAGSYWLNRIDELLTLLKEMVRKSNKPVTIKIRTGFNSEINLVDFCKKVEKTGVSLIAIHGRLRKDFFSGKVNYSLIKEVKENVSIPVLANGEINLENSNEVLDYTRADGIMIGQASLGNPKIFDDLIRQELNKNIKPRDIKDNIKILKEHINLEYSYLDEKRASDILRGISIKYIKHAPNSSSIRSKLVKCKSKKEYIDILDSYLKNI